MLCHVLIASATFIVCNTNSLHCYFCYSVRGSTHLLLLCWCFILDFISYIYLFDALLFHLLQFCIDLVQDKEAGSYFGTDKVSTLVSLVVGILNDSLCSPSGLILQLVFVFILASPYKD